MYLDYLLQIIFLGYFFLMASMKYGIPLLDRDTRFALWQVKMRAVLAQADLDNALEKFGNKDSKTWSDDEKRKNRKALSHIHLHLSNC